MVNDKRFELNEVRSPLLNPDFGNGLEKQFENIDANFKKIANAEYLRGRSGTTTHCVTIKLNRDDNSDTGIWYKNNDEAGQPVSLTSSNILNKLEQVVGQTIEPTINEQGNANYPELILFIEDDNQGHKRAVSSMPFIYHDPELVDLLNDKDYQEQDFQDNSGIFLFNGDDFEKATSYPTLYYNKEIGEFCWIINGTETELIARGPQGAPGQNGTCLVVQIGKMIEVKTEDGQITTPFLYPIRAIMLPDLEKGFTWKKLEDFTEDDPVTNYLHNDQIVIAIPNSGTEIELSNGITYSAHTWACISPIVTRVGDMFESDGDTDYFCVYADYSNTISNVVTNSNLKWILRSVNTNSNDLKGLYVSNNPTSIDNIEYAPGDANYEQTYFPNGVHMMYTNDHNVLNFAHLKKPESTEYKSIADAYMHYNLSAYSFNTRNEVETPTLSFCRGSEIIQGSNDGDLSIYYNNRSTESSTIYNRITVRTIDSGSVDLAISGVLSTTLPLVIRFDGHIANDIGFHLYNKMRIEDSSSAYHYAIPIESSTYIDGGRNPYMLCCYDDERDYLSDYEGLKLIDSGDIDNSCWKIVSSKSSKSGQPWYISVDSLSPVSQIYDMRTLKSHNYSIYGGRLYYKDINFSLVDIKNNICEWICEEDNKVYYSQNPVQELGSNIVLMPKEIGEYSFNEIVGYVKSGETLQLSGNFVSEFKDESNKYNLLLDSRIYININTYMSQANMYLDTWKGLMNYNMESIYPYRGKISTRFGTIDNYCQNYYINGQNILKTIDDIKEKLNTLSSAAAAISYNNEPAYDGEVYTEPAYNGEAYNGEETVNLDEIQNTILTIQNQLDSISNQIPLMIAESMENDEAVQNAISNRILYTMRNNASVSKAIDSKVSASLNDTNSTTYKTMKQQVSNVISTDSNVSDSLSNVVVNSIQTNTNVQNQIKVQTKSALNEDSSKSIIKDVVNNAILNDDTTQLNIENYISDLLVTESQLNNNITQAVMKVANTQAFKNALITSLKDVMVTKEEFNQYINAEVNITEGDSNLS